MPPWRWAAMRSTTAVTSWPATRHARPRQAHDGRGASMKAIVLHGVGDPTALRPEEVADPTPGPGEVVVRLRAAALNHRDLYICQGRYANLRFPIIPGSDGAGEVAAVGSSVTGVAAGDRV